MLLLHHSQLYRGPYLVLKRKDKLFVLQMGDKEDSVSVDRLKSILSTNPVVSAVPATRGRPRHPQLDQPSLHPLQFLLLQMA